MQTKKLETKQIDELTYSTRKTKRFNSESADLQQQLHFMLLCLLRQLVYN